MNIALIGYGKMGKAIEVIALDRGHTIVAKLNHDSSTPLSDALHNADCAIEFTQPDAVINNIKTAIAQQTPIVVGTTGWNDQLNAISDLIEQSNGSLLHASNFSVGVNLFFALNEQLAKLMAKHKSYSVSLEEIHHIHKLDAPSGTAISLADQITGQHQAYSSWHLGKEKTERSIPIDAHRLNEVPGTHSVKYASEIDDITITHEAHNRKGFALGAVIAAEWLVGKKGVFTMKDVLATD